MQLIHARGWRLSPVPHVDGQGGCHRLYRDRFWVSDRLAGELEEQLAEQGLRVEDFTPAGFDCCVMVDPGSQIACLRPAESVDGQAHLPLCAGCRHGLASMGGFPRHREIEVARTAVPRLTAMWLSLGDDDGRRELSHHIRHPVAKILGWAEILTDDDTVDPAHARQLSVIYQCARDLQRLLDNVASPL
ncbi:histidine kinase dimerization/phospho-acceptor domain-containing protein [Actinoplanes oblitus]|uniref:histidine kinase n=1 Tax=Actinoplanes oblitus TaxID=3040509 RepID=A0ABY8WBI7_9ACTN|nr:histidine kinase dimerization/phospho-acceptor domain-containing protein [Actinoplanes oblitus]WIM93075.1 histidine kinase dimerization/phospho-acceptor domain-containing protein [Actinoplanes oblitus]